MRMISKAALALSVMGLSAWMITAQDNGGPGPDGQRPPRPRGPGAQGQPGGPGGPGGGPRDGMRRFPPPPIIGALDANHDGVIDETEIANASAALRTLDKNGDGKLTMDELMPPPRPRGEGPGPERRGPPPGGEGEGQPRPPQREQ